MAPPSALTSALLRRLPAPAAAAAAAASSSLPPRPTNDVVVVGRGSVVGVASSSSSSSVAPYRSSSSSSPAAPPPRTNARSAAGRGGGRGGLRRRWVGCVPGCGTSASSFSSSSSSIGAVRFAGGGGGAKKRTGRGKGKGKGGGGGGGGKGKGGGGGGDGVDERRRMLDRRIAALPPHLRDIVRRNIREEEGRGGGGGGGDSDRGGGPERIPPAYLRPTGSPHVYVAGCAADELGIDSRCLYAPRSPRRGDDDADADTSRPESFRTCRFEYVPPDALGYEYPDPDLGIPEVAFMGRSNVGKSSLINAVTGRRDLARISKRPGRTQQPNYFALIKNDRVKAAGGGRVAFRPGDATGYLVDLPGYGYAEAPEESVDAWQARTQSFLSERLMCGALVRAYLLVDARRGASQFDRAVMGWLDDGSIPYTVVVTKSDLAVRPRLVRWANEACMRYHSQMYGSGGGFQGPVVHLTSAEKRDGIAELMRSVDVDFMGAGAGGGRSALARMGWRAKAASGAGDGDEEEEVHDEDEDEDEGTGEKERVDEHDVADAEASDAKERDIR